MASLKKIINTDDDHVDPSFAITPNSTTTRQPLRPDSSATASTYPPTTRDHPPSAASHNNLLDPAQISRYYSAEPSSSTGALPGRRPSSTSIDSMESPYGPGPSVPSSSSAMRPFAPAMASSDLPKLTPITGKISKAKKGQPVHTCDKCPKTFTRAEHLRRHQLSHAPPELHCNVPNCGKTFYRKDLLERHLQRHEQDDEKPSKIPHHSNNNNNKRRDSRSSHPSSYGSAAHQEAGLQMPAAFASHQINQRSDLSGAPGMSSTWHGLPGPPGGSQNHGSQMDAPDEYSIQGVPDQYVLAPAELPNMQPTTEPFVPDYQPRGLPELSMLYIPDETPAAPAWQDNATMPSSASDSTYSTPSDNTRGHRFPPARTSSGEWNTHIPAYPTTVAETRSPVLVEAGFQIPMSYSVSPPQTYPPTFGGSMGGLPLAGFDENPFLDPDQNPATSVRSLSPQLAVAQSSETLVTIPSVPATDHAYNGAMCGGPSAAGFGFLGSRDMSFTPLTRAARDAIPKYLNVYWDKVHPLYPIVHKSSFETTSGGLSEHGEVLQCAMAAVATQFLDEKEHRNLGAQLHNYAWYKSKVFTTAESWSLPVKQTLLLCEYYARFRGRKKESYKPSQRYNLLYNRVFNNQNAFIPIPTERNTMDQWMDWIDMETRRRLLAACFLLDVHSARYHEQRYTRPNGLDYSYPGGLPIPLSGSTDQLWDASTPQEWSALQTANNLLTLSDFDIESLTAEEISRMSPFDSAIMLAACALNLPCRQDLTQVDSTQKAPDFQIDALPIAKLFPDSAVANTYLALHHTPLHFLLSVSGDSWIFNKKVIEESSFAEHKKSLNEWRKSPSAAVATVFAAKALKAFFSLDATLRTSDEGPVPAQLSSGWRDISDYWGVYVCSLICWAFGRSGRKVKKSESPSREVVMGWIVTVAGMEPSEVQNMLDKHIAHGVVGLVQAELAADCLGGRNILFADAVGVLKTLEQSVHRDYE